MYGYFYAGDLWEIVQSDDGHRTYRLKLPDYSKYAMGRDVHSAAVPWGEEFVFDEDDRIYETGDEMSGYDQCILLPPQADFDSPDFLSGLSKFYVAQGIPRRALPEWVEDTVNGFQGYYFWHDEGVVREYVYDDDDIPLAFEGAERWISDFLRYSANPWRQLPQGRVLRRLLYLAMARAVVLHKPSDNLPGFRGKRYAY